MEPLETNTLPPGIRARLVDGVNGLTMHLLEAGFESAGRPLVLLLHGFPELGYSWRKVMVPLAAAGFHVVAPDQRGYGRTTGWDGAYDGDLASFRLLNLATDALTLVRALGHRSAAGLVGHDFGAPVAAWCALARPDVFRSLALMSAPFPGPPSLPQGAAASGDIEEQLARLPRPRKHYHAYYSTRQADGDMQNCPQGVHDFLRAYYHMKSADWRGNQPFPLRSWSAEELAKMPTYYIMDRDGDMPATVAPEMPSRDEITACHWLSESELTVYSSAFRHTGFQGGLQWYRCRTDSRQHSELALFSGRTIDVPSLFIAGKSDWGVYQVPGSLERMRERACTQMRGCHLIEGAGHWVQQEQPERVSERLIRFLTEAS
jgi:pimeloyl-ACP methyl ester carboxylesterase